MNIKQVTLEELDSCAELFVEVFNLPPWNEGWSTSQAHERLAFYFNTPNFIGVCCYENNKIIGCVFGNYEPYQDNYLYLLKEMFIHPSSQGRGVGTKLVNQLKTELKERNVKLVNLVTKVGSEAEKFYFKNGFYTSKTMGLYVSKLDTK